LFELRLIIEPEAAALAAERRSTRDLARMGHALEEMGRHDLVSPEGLRADQLFHLVVLQAAGNELLSALAATVHASIGYVTEFKSRKRKVARDARPDHDRIFAAIAAGDAQGARQAMSEHIGYSRVEAYSAVGAPPAA
jgi:DNA-binding FadR family transcriptional regulator